MTEYINRVRAINEFAIRSSFYDAEWGNKRFTPDDVEEILQSIPAADVRPVKRGRWIRKNRWSEGRGMGENYGFYYECSICKHTVQGDYGSCGMNFCYQCGADMREARDRD